VLEVMILLSVLTLNFAVCRELLELHPTMFNKETRVLYDYTDC